MRNVLPATLAAAFVLCSAAVAQELQPVEQPDIENLRTVADADGQANVRAGASLDARVTGTVKSGAVVAIGAVTGDWTQLMDDNSAGNDRYIHSSRLRKLDDWRKAPAKNTTPDKGRIETGGVTVEVTAAPFVEKDHKVTRDAEHGLRIDGRAVHGTDGALPQKSLSLTVSIHGKALELPPEATHDLYEPSMDTLMLLTPARPAEHMAVIMWNSDGAGGYMVAWSFVKGRYAGRTLFVP